jgi:hypothetical protein
MPPNKDRSLEFCVVVAIDGVTVYGNQVAIRTVSTWLASIAESNPADHDECHLVWHLTWHFRKKKNVWVLFQRPSRRRRRRRDFDVTFMVVEAKDLRELRRYERSGWLPARWGEESGEREPIRTTKQR